MRCGRKKHLKQEQCPAMGKDCNFCGKANHFESVCLTKKQGTQPKRQDKGKGTRKVHETPTHYESEDLRTMMTLTLFPPLL